MERPEEDQQRDDGRDTEDGRRRLLKGRGLGGWHLISIVGDDLPRASRKKGTPSETSLTCDISRGRDANPARRYEDGRYQDRRREIVEQRHPWAGPQRGPRSPGRPRFFVAAADRRPDQQRGLSCRRVVLRRHADRDARQGDRR